MLFSKKKLEVFIEELAKRHFSANNDEKWRLWVDNEIDLKNADLGDLCANEKLADWFKKRLLYCMLTPLSKSQPIYWSEEHFTLGTEWCYTRAFFTKLSPELLNFIVEIVVGFSKFRSTVQNEFMISCYNDGIIQELLASKDVDDKTKHKVFNSMDLTIGCKSSSEWDMKWSAFYRLFWTFDLDINWYVKADAIFRNSVLDGIGNANIQLEKNCVLGEYLSIIVMVAGGQSGEDSIQLFAEQIQFVLDTAKKCNCGYSYLRATYPYQEYSVLFVLQNADYDYEQLICDFTSFALDNHSLLVDLSEHQEEWLLNKFQIKDAQLLLQVKEIVQSGINRRQSEEAKEQIDSEQREKKRQRLLEQMAV